MQVIRKKQFLEEHISETEMMLHDDETGNTHLLNSTASAFYNQCGDITLDDAIDEYVECYRQSEVSIKKLRQDARTIYEKLRDMGVIGEEDIDE